MRGRGRAHGAGLTASVHGSWSTTVTVGGGAGAGAGAEAGGGGPRTGALGAALPAAGADTLSLSFFLSAPCPLASFGRSAAWAGRLAGADAAAAARPVATRLRSDGSLATTLAISSFLSLSISGEAGVE